MDNLSLDETKALASCYSTMRGTSNLSVFALSGDEGDRTTYTSKLTFSDLAENFNIVPQDGLPAGVMLQRELAKSRSRAIANYILSSEDFIFPEVIAIVETLSVSEFKQMGNVVQIQLDKTAFRYLVDGQGRLLAIKTLLEKHPELVSKTIDVKFVESRGIEADAQIFSDINGSQLAPNSSQHIAMDSRKVLSRFTKEAVRLTPSLCNIVDFTKSSVTTSSKTDNVWTLNQLSKFLLILTGASAKKAETLFSDEAERTHWIGFLKLFFDKATCNPYIRETLVKGRSGAKGSIIGTATFLKSFALFGRIAVLNSMMEGQGKMDWSFMDKIADVDFSVENPEWIGRCLNGRGKFEDKTFNHGAVASYLCAVSGLHVPEELEAVEEEVLMMRAKIKRQLRESEGDKQASLKLAS